MYCKIDNPAAMAGAMYLTAWQAKSTESKRMKYLKQFLIIIAVTFVGELLKYMYCRSR